MGYSTEFMADQGRYVRRCNNVRASHAQSNIETKPDNGANSHLCPYCDRPFPHERGILSTFRDGVHGLFYAVWTIVSAAVRLIRFAVAAAFCFVGLVGHIFRVTGQVIAHPSDRRLLMLGRSRANI